MSGGSVVGEPVVCPSCRGNRVRPCTRCNGEGAIPGPKACPACAPRGCTVVRGVDGKSLVLCDACDATGVRAEVRPGVIAACSCCGRTFTEAAWLELGYVGVQDDGEGGHLELRNCRCRSTLSVQLPRLGGCYLTSESVTAST